MASPSIGQIVFGTKTASMACAILDESSAPCNLHRQLPETRQLLMRLAERFRENQPWDPAAFHRESQISLAAPGGKFGKFEDEKYDRSLNEMAYAFLYPPSSALWSAVLQDFEHATRLREANVVHYLFLTTRLCFRSRRFPATMRAFENLSRTARKTRERCQPVLFSMVESDLVSPVEHHLVAPSFDGSLYEQKVSKRTMAGSFCMRLSCSYSA